jgi:hypothetical protein
MDWLQEDVMSDLLSQTNFLIWRPEVDVFEKKMGNYHKSATRTDNS